MTAAVNSQYLLLSDRATVLLRRFMLTLCLATIVNALNLLLTGRLEVRSLPVGLPIVVTAFCYLELRAGRARRGVVVFCWGMWASAFTSAFVGAAINTPFLFVIPVVLMTTAWAHGRRATVWMTVLTIIAFGMLALSEYQGWLPKPLIRTSLDRAIIFSTIGILASVLALAIVESLRMQVVREQTLSKELRELNETLEARIEMRTQEVGRAKDAAEAANNAKSTFLANMSHELRTPLNAILGFGQILASETLPSTPAQKKEFTSHILRAGRHLLTLINEILDLAQIEAGKVTLSPEPISVAELLLDCQSMTEPLGMQRNVRMIFPKNCELHVVADRIRLKQVVLNLLSNAIKYNRENGTVVVDAVEATSERIRISVQDTGLGLNPEQLTALFQPFNRLGQEKSAEEGTGIGLVVTKRLVDLMGGEIGVSSTVGIGTVFSVELKAGVATQHIATEQIGQVSAKVPVQRDGAVAQTVLYVEDNPTNLKLVEQLIGYRADLRLMSAPDGKLGIDLARAHMPRVILLDINLPGIDGHEVLKILRNDPRTADIPVIAVSANAMPRDIAKGLAAGFLRYLTKPINIEELNDAINSALGLTSVSPARNQ